MDLNMASFNGGTAQAMDIYISSAITVTTDINMASAIKWTIEAFRVRVILQLGRAFGGKGCMNSRLLHTTVPALLSS